ncbi:MAG: hypothetical protein AB9917_19220 [Negativicutes bacterium]
MNKCWRFQYVLLFLLFCGVFLLAQTAQAAIRVVEEPGVDTLAMQDIRSAVDAFEQLLKNEMGTDLKQEVSLYVCPDRNSYLRVRQRVYLHKKDSAEKADRAFGGAWYNQSGFGVILMDLSNPALKSGQDRVSFVGRQLFYQAIYQWAGDDFTKKALQWLAEGTANLVGARVGEAIGYESVDKWKLDRFNALRGVKRSVSPNDIVHRNPDLWLKFIQEGRRPDALADLMVFFLIKQKGLPSIASYFTNIPVVSSDKAFEKAFRLDIGQYLSDFQAWYILAMGEPAQIQFSVRGAVSEDIRAYFEKGAELARQLAFDSWNAQMRDAFRVVLTENRDAYVATMAREFGLSTEEAAAQAKNEIWTDQGSVVVMNVAAMTAPEEKIYQVAFVALSRIINETGGAQNMDNMKWLSYGAASTMAARSAERSGFARYGDFQGSWEYGLAQSRSWPTLVQLTTLPQWSAAAEKHGPVAVRSVAALSAHYLSDKHNGYAKTGEWLKASNISGNPSASFQKVYGITPAQLWEQARDFVEPGQNYWTAPSQSASEETR